MKKRHILLNGILALSVLILLNIFLWKPLYSLFDNLENLKIFIEGYGNVAPLVLIFLVILQIFIAPIPGQIIGIASGYVFGAFWGTLYSMIGVVVGSYLAFLLSRKYGRPIAEKFVKKETLSKFDNFLQDKGVFALFLAFLLPVFPDDVLCYIAGLSNIKIRTLVIIATVGRLPGFLILNMIGAGFANLDTRTSVLLFSIIILVSFFVFIYRKPLEKKFQEIIKSSKNKINFRARKD